MAVPFSNTKVRVPKGFQNVLEGLAREVLRSQPKDVYDFGYKYLEACLKEREETGHDPVVHGAKLEDRFYNNDAFKNPSVDPSNPQHQDAALKIQTQVRQHQAVNEVLSKEEEEAAETIQAGFRGYTDRQKVLQMKDPEEYERRQREIETRLASSKTQEQEEEVDIDLNDPEVEKAAVKIQAGFKGFKARKEVKDSQTKLYEDLEGYTSEGTEPLPPPTLEVQSPPVEDVLVPPVPTDLQVRSEYVPHVEGVGERREGEEEIKTPLEDILAPPLQDRPTETPEEEEIDIDLNDPDVQAATLKIQSKFKKRK